MATANKPVAKKTLTKEQQKERPLPKTLAACADEMYQVRQERYALQKQVDALKAREARLGEELINKLPKSQASGIAGKLARAAVENKTVYTVKDWDKLHGYILANAKKAPGVWSLMQLRLGEAAVKEMATEGFKLPRIGVEALEVPQVSLTKL